MSEDLPELTGQPPVQRHAGRPQEPFRERESTRWQRFLHLVCPWLRERGKLADNLAQQIARAEARRRTAEARKAEADARKAAAEADEIGARVDQRRLRSVKVACDLADELFEQSPEMADALKRAAFEKLTPDLAEQIVRIRAMQADLRRRHGAQVQIITDSTALPVPKGSQSQPNV